MNDFRIFALRVAGTIFGLVALMHLVRIVTVASVTISGWELPVWVNWLGLFGASFLCAWLWRLSINKGK